MASDKGADARGVLAMWLRRTVRISRDRIRLRLKCTGWHTIQPKQKHGEGRRIQPYRYSRVTIPRDLWFNLTATRELPSLVTYGSILPLLESYHPLWPIVQSYRYSRVTIPRDLWFNLTTARELPSLVTYGLILPLLESYHPLWQSSDRCEIPSDNVIWQGRDSLG